MIPDYGSTGLPLPLRDGYALNPVNKIASTEFEVGRGVQRWEYDDAPLYPEVSWLFTDAEARLFVAWTNQVAKAGWFTMRLVTPMGFDDLVVRLKTTPKGAELAGRYAWRYTATLEVEFEPMLEEGWAEILPEWILNADIFDKAMNREWPMYIGRPILTENGLRILAESGNHLTTER